MAFIGERLRELIDGRLYNHKIGLYLGFSVANAKQYAYFYIITPDSEPYTADNVYSKLKSYGYDNRQPTFWLNNYSTSSSGVDAKYWLVTGVGLQSGWYLIYGLDCTDSTITMPKGSGGGMISLASLAYETGGEMTDTVTPLTSE